MPKISANLEQQFKDAPQETFDLIVRTDGDAAKRITWMKSEGVTVRRHFRLTPGVAITCAGEDALRLSAADWVISVELDAPVHTMRPDRP